MRYGAAYVISASRMARIEAFDIFKAQLADGGA